MLWTITVIISFAFLTVFYFIQRRLIAKKSSKAKEVFMRYFMSKTWQDAVGLIETSSEILLGEHVPAFYYSAIRNSVLSHHDYHILTGLNQMYDLLVRCKRSNVQDALKEIPKFTYMELQEQLLRLAELSPSEAFEYMELHSEIMKSDQILDQLFANGFQHQSDFKPNQGGFLLLCHS